MYCEVQNKSCGHGLTYEKCTLRLNRSMCVVALDKLIQQFGKEIRSFLKYYYDP